MDEADVGAGFPETGDATRLLPAVQQGFQIAITACYLDECPDDFATISAPE